MPYECCRLLDQVSLVSAGLLIDPGITGHILIQRRKDKPWNGDLSLEFKNGQSVSIPRDTKIPDDEMLGLTGPIQLNEDEPAVPCYLLTEVGGAISTIFPTNDAVALFVEKLRQALPDVEVIEYQADDEGRYIINSPTSGMRQMQMP